MKDAWKIEKALEGLTKLLPDGVAPVRQGPQKRRRADLGPNDLPEGGHLNGNTHDLGCPMGTEEAITV